MQNDPSLPVFRFRGFLYLTRIHSRHMQFADFGKLYVSRGIDCYLNDDGRIWAQTDSHGEVITRYNEPIANSAVICGTFCYRKVRKRWGWRRSPTAREESKNN